MDDEIDQYEVEIDRLATEFIARHQPTATDLRFVIVAIKLGPELERIADNAVNIAERILHLSKYPLLKPPDRSAADARSRPRHGHRRHRRLRGARRARRRATSSAATTRSTPSICRSFASS